MSWSDHVFPHGPLVELVPGFWQVTGSAGRSPLSRNMHIWRVPDGICIHNGVALEEPAMAEVEALGPPRILVVPNGLHRMDCAVFKERYPGLQVVAPRAARDQVAQKVAVDAVAEHALPAVGTECLTLAGCKPGELVYRVPLPDGRHALVFTDALFHHPHVPGLAGLLMRYVTASTGHFGITRLGRWMMLEDGPRFAAFLRELADAPGLAAIGVGHGEAIVEDPTGALRAAADRV